MKKNNEQSIGLNLWLKINSVVLIIGGIIIHYIPEIQYFIEGIIVTTLFGIPILMSYIQNELDKK